jgi:hypothetical protein
MNYAGLKKLERRHLNIYPPPYWVQGRRTTPMQWTVYRVDAKERVAEVHAPSGHLKNLAGVIHHYDEAGNNLVLDAQLIIDGDAVVVEPRPWGATTRRLRRGHRLRRLQSFPIAQAPEPVRTFEPPATLKDVLALIGLVAVVKIIVDL